MLTIDAHYRPISVLEFSHDDSALVSGGEDAGVSVWSIGRLVFPLIPFLRLLRVCILHRLMNATPMDPPTPFATLTDHTLPITAIAVGLGTFPKCRILTASSDATVKVISKSLATRSRYSPSPIQIWDFSTSTPTLLSTFSFPSPVSHIAWDPLERFFFAAGPVPPTAPGNEGSAENGKKFGGSRVMRVDLFKRRRDEMGYEMTEAVGGGGRGEIDTVVDAKEYWVA